MHTNIETENHRPPGGRCGVFHGSAPSRPPVSLWSVLDGHTLRSGPPSWLSAHSSPGAVSLTPSLFGATGNVGELSHITGAIIKTYCTSKTPTVGQQNKKKYKS